FPLWSARPRVRPAAAGCLTFDLQVHATWIVRWSPSILPARTASVHIMTVPSTLWNNTRSWPDIPSLRAGIRPRVRLAHLAVARHSAVVGRIGLVQLRHVVVGHAERLLHHHRRQRAVPFAAHVAVVQRVPELVVDGVLTIGGHVRVERL